MEEEVQCSAIVVVCGAERGGGGGANVLDITVGVRKRNTDSPVNALGSLHKYEQLSKPLLTSFYTE